jgi:hypothetical protein
MFWIAAGLVLASLGVAMLMNVKRIEKWQRRRFPGMPVARTALQGAFLLFIRVFLVIGGM